MRVNTAVPAFVLLFSACSTSAALPPIDASPHDASAPADAGTDASPTLDANVFDALVAPERDAAVPEDAVFAADGSTPAIDAGGADGGSPLDAGADGGASLDAGSAPDAATACAPDAYEPNDVPESASVVRTGAGWPVMTYDMTWDAGDDSDWIAAELDATGVPGRFRVSASEATSAAVAPDVELRVTCPRGLYVCTGSGATAVGNTCVARRRGNVFVDVTCDFTTDTALSVRVGVHRNDAATACEHATMIYLAAVGT